MISRVIFFILTMVLKNKLVQNEAVVADTIHSLVRTGFQELLNPMATLAKKTLVAVPFSILLGVLLTSVYSDLVYLLDHRNSPLNPSFYLNLFSGGILVVGLYFLFRSQKKPPIEVMGAEYLIPKEDFIEGILHSFGKGFQEKFKNP